MKINLHFEKIKYIGQRVFVLAGENTFISFLILLIVAILISIVVAYQYILVIDLTSVQVQPSQTVFQEQQFLGILENLDARAVKFRRIDFKQYSNIFLSPDTVLSPTGSIPTSQ